MLLCDFNKKNNRIVTVFCVDAKRWQLKILHFSDTHLGFNDLDVLNDENINQREADFYDAFAQVIEQIKKIKPDYIIHTGDLFHRSSPSNRTITCALEQFNKNKTLYVKKDMKTALGLL